MRGAATVISQIFAVSASVDHNLGLLLVRVLGADAIPALAMFSILETQSLQRKALIAAAKSALDENTYKMFHACLTVAESAQSERHRLAHWIWASCPEIEDAFLLADPRHLREHTIAMEQLWHPKVRTLETWEKANLDRQKIMVYRRADLDRALRDLREAETVLEAFHSFMEPAITADQAKEYGFSPEHPGTRAGALQRLNASQPFRQALSRARDKAKAKNNNPPAQP